MVEKKNRIWRLGADLGANSLGWAAIELDAPVNGKPISILAAGARIFRVRTHKWASQSA